MDISLRKQELGWNPDLVTKSSRPQAPLNLLLSFWISKMGRMLITVGIEETAYINTIQMLLHKKNFGLSSPESQLLKQFPVELKRENILPKT